MGNSPYSAEEAIAHTAQNRSCLPKPVHRSCFPVNTAQARSSGPGSPVTDKAAIEAACKQQRERFNSCFSDEREAAAYYGGEEERAAEAEASKGQCASEIESKVTLHKQTKKKIDGKWKLLRRSDNFEDVLSQMGIGWVLRKLVTAMVGQTVLYQAIIHDGDVTPEFHRTDIGGTFTADKEYHYLMDGETAHSEEVPGVGDFTLKVSFVPNGFELKCMGDGKSLVWSQDKIFVVSDDGKSGTVTATMTTVEGHPTYKEHWTKVK